MKFKDHILNIVKEEHPIEKGVEYQRTKAQLQDSITAFMEGLTPAQRVMLDQTILQPIDSLLELQQMLTFDATFSVLNRSWRELLLGERFEPEDFEV